LTSHYHRDGAHDQPNYHSPPAGGDGYYSEGYGGAEAAETQLSHDETPLTAGEEMDRAVDDIFSCARHNRLEEVKAIAFVHAACNLSLYALSVAPT